MGFEAKADANVGLSSGATRPDARPSVVQWDVRPGTASRPMPKFFYRLRAPLRWWSCSIARILVAEVCSLPLRIVAILRAPNQKTGVYIPSLSDASGFEYACSEGIRELQRAHRWCGVLDCRTYV